MIRTNLKVFASVGLIITSLVIIVISYVFAQINESILKATKNGDHINIKRLTQSQYYKNARLIFNSVSASKPSSYFATISGEAELFLLDNNTSKWVPLKSFPSVERPLNNVVFIDNQTGFVIGNGGNISKTVDGGKTWNQCSKFTNLNLKKIIFANSQVGYLTGELARVKKSGNISYTHEIYKTNDGGNTWKKVYSKINADFTLYDFSLKSTNEIATIIGKTLLFTIDGGKTWKNVVLPDFAAAITFSRDGIGWIFQMNGETLRSNDGGTTWQKENIANAQKAKCKWTSARIGSDGHGLAVSEEGCVAFTRDGNKWTLLNDRLQDCLTYIFVGDKESIIVGYEAIYLVEF
ncbi:MAG TPA: hypothetical protein VNK07_00025 [Candidatus Binatia bacterium]|nr:hypothetical protein [Candidatus Binatia bacterium]